MSNDPPVTREEMEQAGRIVISRLDLEGQIAFNLFMSWFNEQLTALHVTMREANRKRDMQIAALQQTIHRMQLEKNR